MTTYRVEYLADDETRFIDSEIVGETWPGLADLRAHLMNWLESNPVGSGTDDVTAKVWKYVLGEEELFETVQVTMDEWAAHPATESREAGYATPVVAIVLAIVVVVGFALLFIAAKEEYNAFVSNCSAQGGRVIDDTDVSSGYVYTGRGGGVVVTSNTDYYCIRDGRILDIG